ncbi:MAG: RICIN domain-containing protein [Parolsenella sp.]|uniref:RICIN domain-containing protein n=1 Tax=Parolsenella sp. TaxID=2083006 RepID=UPI002A75CEB0|nr:RICIN domain-containing protein [Parolsenella sp.]MCI5950136.1 RICIN domain-containing protein [Coriobacteriaceae bacterium]MDY3292075.1 RICIN domain-containing protein [Parolsenella sp.]
MFKRGICAALSAAGLSLLMLFGACPSRAFAETMVEEITTTYGTFDRSDAYDGDEPGGYINSGIMLFDLGASRINIIEPMAISEEMLYFCRYESNQNYAQELSSGDEFHAMGYFQFDNRYGLGAFLEAAYNYNPSKYWSLKQIGDLYGWNTNPHGSGGSTDFYLPGRQYSLREDLNYSWREAYKADPIEFSQLQNRWAYDNYYAPARDYIASRYGIDLDNYRDCVRGMAWGMCNLFGQSGWQKWANDAALTMNMDDADVAGALANALISGIEGGKYSYKYGSSYVRRYRSELDDCLRYMGRDIASLASENQSVLANGTYVIKAGKDQSKVLDVANASSENGANVQLYLSNSASSQRWVVKNVGDGYITLTNEGSGKALDISSALRRRGANVQQWEPNGTEAQRWVPVKNSDGSITLYSALGQNLVLDVFAGSTADGANLQIFNTDATQSQHFYFSTGGGSAEPEVSFVQQHAGDLSNGIYVINAAESAMKVLDVANGSTANGANIRLYPSNQTSAQQWRVTHDGDGYVTLTNVNSGKVLDVANGNASNAANVWQYASNGSAAQKWIAVKQPDGSYVFHSKLSEKMVLDLHGCSTNTYTNLELNTSNGGVCQKFGLQSVSNDYLENVARASRDVVSDGRYRIDSCVAADRTVDVQWASRSDGAKVQLWNWNGTNAQLWDITHDADGFVVIRNVESGKALDVRYASAVTGADVWQYGFNNSSAQKWIAVREGDGIVLYSALGNGLVLDIQNGSSANGAKLQLYTANDTKAQKFSFSGI